MNLAAVTPAQLVYPAFVLVVAGVVKGFVGMGLPAVAMGLLGLMVPTAQASALLVLPATVTNLWQLAAGPNLRGLLRRLWPMLLGIVAGGWIGSGQMTGANADRAHIALGVVMVLYAVLGLSAWQLRVPPRLERRLAPVAGAVTGVITSFTGLFMIPAVPFLNGIGLDKEDLVQAVGLCFTVSTFTLAADLGSQGQFDRNVLIGSALALIPAGLGMALGTWLRGRISNVLFRRCFFVGLLILGAQLALG